MNKTNLPPKNSSFAYGIWVSRDGLEWNFQEAYANEAHARGYAKDIEVKTGCSTVVKRIRWRID